MIAIFSYLEIIVATIIAVVAIFHIVFNKETPKQHPEHNDTDDGLPTYLDYLQHYEDDEQPSTKA